MNEHQIQIIAEVKKIVTDIFDKKVNPLFIFHNLEHTRQVVDAVEVIGRHYQLNSNNQLILLVSAWFHDTGFSAGQAEGHEKESIKLATDFLQHHYADQEFIFQVTSCIQSTQMPPAPANLSEQIICDADLFHLGTDKFSEMTELLRQELQVYYNKEFSKEKWRQWNIEFLVSHKYFTGYCQLHLEPVKQKWIDQLRNGEQSFKSGAI